MYAGRKKKRPKVATKRCQLVRAHRRNASSLTGGLVSTKAGNSRGSLGREVDVSRLSPGTPRESSRTSACERKLGASGWARPRRRRGSSSRRHIDSCQRQFSRGDRRSAALCRVSAMSKSRRATRTTADVTAPCTIGGPKSQSSRTKPETPPAKIAHLTTNVARPTEGQANGLRCTVFRGVPEPARGVPSPTSLQPQT